MDDSNELNFSGSGAHLFYLNSVILWYSPVNVCQRDSDTTRSTEKGRISKKRGSKLTLDTWSQR